ncbi:uncharacterized protein ACHE_70313S [Aspergillus chevalieri]|uniref:Uncharacterized protein n=1 Tax=Aspergillus chevalieri TaxID=182096 RepID=A0A7R7VVB7_ASPCH|nr:uncharacterized protein ACHE_70313S [Aspergillus chevalieri]BCR91470.1 hypothetical protein ACHE_70313S [Aspergillus chevalieri]
MKHRIRTPELRLRKLWLKTSSVAHESHDWAEEAYESRDNVVSLPPTLFLVNAVD